MTYDCFDIADAVGLDNALRHKDWHIFPCPKCRHRLAIAQSGKRFECRRCGSSGDSDAFVRFLSSEPVLNEMLRRVGMLNGNGHRPTSKKRTHPKTTLNDVRRLYEALYGPGMDGKKRYIELRKFERIDEDTLQPRGSEFFQSVDPILLRIKDQRPNEELFLGAHLRDFKGGKSEDAVSHVGSVFADVDLRKKGKPVFSGGRREALALIRAFPTAPSAIIWSGHGFHVYWILDKWTRREDFPEYANVMTGIARRLRGDDVADLPRIMRVVGSVNFKNPKKPVRGRIVEVNYDA